MSVEQLTHLNDDGTTFGQSNADKVSLHNATPVARRADASQVAITDSSGGTNSNTIAAGVGLTIMPIYLQLAQLADGEVISTFTPGFRGKITKVEFYVEVAVTTASKLSSLNLEIETTNLTGGVIALTSANCTPKGIAVGGSAVTAANIFTAVQQVSVEASSTTTFIEGTGWLFIYVQNMDTADAFALMADKWNELRTALTNKGLITGAA